MCKYCGGYGSCHSQSGDTASSFASVDTPGGLSDGIVGAPYPVLVRRWPKIPKTVWLTKIAAMPLGSTWNLPVVVVTRLAAPHQSQDLMASTKHEVMIQPTHSILPTPLASGNPGLVVGRTNNRPACLVASDALSNCAVDRRCEWG